MGACEKASDGRRFFFLISAHVHPGNPVAEPRLSARTRLFSGGSGGAEALKYLRLLAAEVAVSVGVRAQRILGPSYALLSSSLGALGAAEWSKLIFARACPGLSLSFLVLTRLAAFSFHFSSGPSFLLLGKQRWGLGPFPGPPPERPAPGDKPSLQATTTLF